MKLIGRVPEEPEERARFLRREWETRNSPQYREAVERSNKAAAERLASKNATRSSQEGR